MCDSEAKAPVVMASPSVTELSDINGAADHAAENTHDEASSQTLDVNVHAEATANVTEDATFSDVEVDTASVQKKKNRRKRHGQKGGKNDEIPASNVINVTKVVDLSAPNLAQKQREASNVEALKQDESEKKKKRRNKKSEGAGATKGAESSSPDCGKAMEANPPDRSAATILSGISKGQPGNENVQPEMGKRQTEVEGEAKQKLTRRSARSKKPAKSEQFKDDNLEAAATRTTTTPKSSWRQSKPEAKVGGQAPTKSWTNTKAANHSLQLKNGTPSKPLDQLNSGQNKFDRNKFSPYLDPEVVQLRLERGQLLEGAVRINRKNYKDAFISSPDGWTADILVSEVQNRNRALDRDKVAVELNDPKEWIVLNDQIRDQMLADEAFKKLIEKLDKKFANSVDESDDIVNSNDPDVIVEEVIYLQNGQEVGRETIGEKEKKKETPSHNSVNPQWPKSKNVEQPNFRLDLVQRLPSWELYVQRTGRVVSIIEKVHSRKAAGHLEMFTDGNQKFALFRPTDNRFPRMKIPKDNCPPDFFVRSNDFKDYLFIAEIEKWEQVNFAMGKLIRELGKDSNISVRTESILLEADIDISEFSDEVNSCLPALPFVIPEEEIKKRRDFRQKCIFTIDPMTARDLDDAVSIEPLSNGRFRVGVHIADVSFFVKENTKLDEVAASRATSVYMVQKVIPMLPRTLCEDLCSLNPGVDRLTFSVEWIMNENGEIESEWFGRSVIRSCVKLAYEHAQLMINEPSREWKTDELPALESPWTYRDISEKINMMQKIAVNLRMKRVESGALRIDQPKICFILDKETWLPQTFKLYEARDSNRLIEEFMLLANMSVAKKLYSTFPELAVLRCHPPPQSKSLGKVISILKAFGIVLDAQSSKTLQQSFDAFKAKALGNSKHKNLDQKGRFEGLKKSKNEVKASKDGAGKAKISSAENVDNLVDMVDEISLNSDRETKHEETKVPLKKSEVAKANISKDYIGLQTRKFYDTKPLSREKKAELEFQVLMSLCAKPMMPAEYFCAENKNIEQCHHYALSVDLYTHFTSPIRRYPDILVHRLLDAALTGLEPNWNVSDVSEQCKHCNVMKTTAKNVSEKSDELFLTFFVKEMGPYTVHAMVIQILDRSVECILMDMAVVKRVYFDQLDDLMSYQFVQGRGKKSLELKWKNNTGNQQQQGGNGNATVTQRLSLFSHVLLTLQGTVDDFSAVLIHPLD